MVRGLKRTRVIESAHTNQWAIACAELHAMADDPALRASASDLGAPWDRNLLLYAMLTIQLSMAGHPLADVDTSVLELHHRAGDALEEWVEGRWHRGWW